MLPGMKNGKQKQRNEQQQKTTAVTTKKTVPRSKGVWAHGGVEVSSTGEGLGVSCASCVELLGCTLLSPAY